MGASGGAAVTATALRSRNRSRVLQEIARAGALSRSAIASNVGLTPAAVSRITRELIDVGLLVEGGEKSSGGPGRHSIDLEIAPRGGFVVGLGFEAYSQTVAVADLSGEIIVRRTIQVETPAHLSGTLAEAACEIEAALIEAGVPRSRVLGVGVAMVGKIDPETGRLARSPAMGCDDTEVQALLEDRLGLPVQVDNLLNAANLMEYEAGACRDVRNVILVRAALAVNASILLDGRLLRNRAGGIGHIGHGRVGGVETVCPCGRTGCLDMVGSGWAVLMALGEITVDEIRPERFSDHARALSAALARAAAGEESVRHALGAAGRHLGQFLCGLGAALAPERIVLTGPLGTDAHYEAGVRDGLEANFFAPPDHDAKVLVSRTPAEAVAVHLAVSTFLRSDRLDLAPLRHAVTSGPAPALVAAPAATRELDRA